MALRCVPGLAGTRAQGRLLFAASPPTVEGELTPGIRLAVLRFLHASTVKGSPRTDLLANYSWKLVRKQPQHETRCSCSCCLDCSCYDKRNGRCLHCC